MRQAVLTPGQGGYYTNVDSEHLKPYDLLTAQNCYWDGHLRKRNGIGVYATNSWATADVVQGYHRLYVSTDTAWYAVMAVDDGSTVIFYYSTSTGATAIDTSYTWTTGNEVEMDSMDGEVIAVNGTDKPAYIYHDGSGWVIDDLEIYDTRTRATTNWFAGYLDASGVAASVTTGYIDDSTDARDEGTDDFDLNQNVASDGIWVACDYTFNRLYLYGVDTLASDLVLNYEYYKGSGTWGTCSMVTSLSLDVATGTLTVEWNYPTDWAVADSSLSTDQLDNRYVFRMYFTTNPSATTVCDYLDVAHTQYLTQIFDDERPRTVRVHKNHFFLGFENTLNHSPYHQATGWRAGDVYYFEEGGTRINALEPHGEYLAVVKDGGIHGVFGNSFANFYQKYLTKGGTISGRSVIAKGTNLFMANKDGIYRWDGTERLKISKHIQDDYDSLVASNVAMDIAGEKVIAIDYQGWIYISFPSNSTTLIFDPDTCRIDDFGDGRVSFYKFDNYRADIFSYHNGAGDNGYLIAVANFAPPMLQRCNSAVYETYDNISATVAIDMQMQTPYFPMENFEEAKHYGRVKPKLGEVASPTNAACVFTIYGQDGTSSAVTTFTVATGSGWWSTDVSIPYELDGKAIGFKIQHNQISAFKVAGLSLDYEPRSF